MVAVALTRDEDTAGERRRVAAARPEGAAARRMLGLALVLEGSPRAVAAKTCGMDRQTLRDWVHRYNAAGPDGLLNRREGLGRKPLPTPEQTAVVAKLVRNGPDLATHGVVRWRRADLAPVIEQRFGVRPDVRTVGTGHDLGALVLYTSGRLRLEQSRRKSYPQLFWWLSNTPSMKPRREFGYGSIA